MSKPQFVPADATRMECLVLSRTLRKMKAAVLDGTPFGLAIDQALEETLELATEFSNCGKQPTSG